MEEKIKKRSLIVLIIAVFIGIFVLVLNASYAFFTTEVNSKNYIAYTGTLKVDFTKDSDVLDITNAVPMTNAEGLASSDNSYAFGVTNTGTIAAKYQVRLELLKENTKEYIPLEYIKLAYSTDGTSYSDPIRLSDLESNLVFIEPTQLDISGTDSYTIKLWIDYSAPNEVIGKTFKAQVVVDAVQDLDSDHMEADTAPIIVLNKNSRGNLDEKITVGSTYTDPGILSITDDNDVLDKDNVVITYKYFDGETTSTVSSVNTSNAGVYYVEYSITDSASNVGKAERVVIVNPTPTTPTITLVGDNPLTVGQNATFTDPGVTVATGNRVVTLGEVKTSAQGSYTVRYIVIDKDGNMNSITRTVNVAEGVCTYSMNQQFEFPYNGTTGTDGTVQNFKAECDGQYKLEVWGAQGGWGYSNSYPGGKGGYSVGIVNLEANTDIYIYSGGQGTSDKTASGGGFNGGGNHGSSNSSTATDIPGGGGGASDIRIGTDSLYARVIVAGGGGGNGIGDNGSRLYTPGVGGGTSGGQSVHAANEYEARCSKPGTQTSGGSTSTTNTTNATAGSFGQGGRGANGEGGGAGGGGGWYGAGGAGYGSAMGGAASGGSGYVYTSSTASNYPSGCLLNSSYYLTSASTTAGNTSFTSPTGTSETGHSGNGYARITYLGN